MQPEEEEFRRAVGDVQPLRQPRRLAPEEPRPAPLPRQTREDERAALMESVNGQVSIDDAIDSGDELVYVREGVSRQVLRRLRRGYWVVEDDLDLHGMNRREAAISVAEFLRRCRVRGTGCVRIVHGKGLGSPHREPVLKGKLRQWLVHRDEVLAFCQAPSAQGGSGALLVLLKLR